MANENPFAQYLTQSNELQNRGKDMLMQSMGTPQMDSGQVLSVLLGSALPAVFGGILGGSTGLQAGAAGGATGAEFGIKQAQADAERKQKLAQVLATQDLEQAQQLRTQAFTGQRDVEKERQNEERDAARFAQQDKTQAASNASIAERMSAGFANSSALLDKRLAAEKENRKTFNDRANTKLLNTEQKDMNAVYEKDPTIKTVDATLLEVAPLKLMLENPTAVNAGAISNKLARVYGEKGVMTEQDVTRAMPKPLVAKTEELRAYLTANPNIQTIPPEYVTAIKKNISDIESALKSAGSSRVKVLSKDLDGIAEYTKDAAPEKIDATKSRYASRYGEAPVSSGPALNVSDFDLSTPEGQAQYKEAYKAKKLAGGL